MTRRTIFGFAAGGFLSLALLLMGVRLVQQNDAGANDHGPNARLGTPFTEGSKQIEVKVASPWTNTGIEVQKGQRISITSTGRGVWKNLPESNPNSYPRAKEECGPDGSPPIDTKDYYSNISEYQCPRAYKGAVIGKVGENGDPFPVGSNLSEVMSQSGVLYLGVNDKKPELGIGNWADNSGSFLAHVSVEWALTTPSTEILREQYESVKRIEVAATQMWVDTGVDITGKEFQIDYDSGEWTNVVGSNYCGARGKGPYPNLLVANAPLSALVGKTNGTTFYVGNNYRGREQKGRLYLSLNDKPGFFSDNGGALYVIVSIIER